jgi:hypothetical protein
VLRLACPERPRRVIAVGFPMVYRDTSGLFEDCGVPRTFLQSTHDQYGAVAELARLVESLPGEKRLVPIEAGDHFFEGGLQELEEAVAKLD